MLDDRFLPCVTEVLVATSGARYSQSDAQRAGIAITARS